VTRAILNAVVFLLFCFCFVFGAILPHVLSVLHFAFEKLTSILEA